MTQTGKRWITGAALLATVSLGTNGLLWSRYTPDRTIVRYGDGSAVSRGTYQTALESADASGDTLDHLLLGSTYDPLAAGGDGHAGVTGSDAANAKAANATKSRLTGREVRVADAEPFYRPRRAAAKHVRSRVVRRRPQRPVAAVMPSSLSRAPRGTLLPKGKAAQRIATASDSSLPSDAPLDLSVTSAVPAAIGGGDVVAQIPAAQPGMVSFAQPASGLGAAPAISTGSLVPGGIIGSTLLGAVASNGLFNGIGDGASGGTIAPPSGSPPIGGAPVVPEPAPLVLAAGVGLALATLMARRRAETA